MKYILVILLFFVSCKNEKHEYVLNMLQDWDDKEFLLPSKLNFTIDGKEYIDYKIQTEIEYKLVVYVDSTGCTSCKLRLPAWKEFMSEVDSLAFGSVQFLFFFVPKNEKELSNILLIDRFRYPVCVDPMDSLNILNNIPKETMFQTFLLNKSNRVVAIGNPVHNSKVKELYLNIITGKKTRSEINNKVLTSVSPFGYNLDMGTFDWEKEQIKELSFTNTGNNPLIWENISTSCGCTTVEYTKKPILPNEKTSIKIIYKADHPEHFNKTVTIYCNSAVSPIRVKVTGYAH